MKSKLELQTHFSAKSQSEGTIQLVQDPRKMSTIIERRWRGTWQEVPMATWYSEWICRMRRGLVHHIVKIPPTLFLLPLRGATVCVCCCVLVTRYWEIVTVPACPRVNRPQIITWGGRILTLHLNYVAGDTAPLHFLLSCTNTTQTKSPTIRFCTRFSFPHSPVFSGTGDLMNYTPFAPHELLTT